MRGSGLRWQRWHNRCDLAELTNLLSGLHHSGGDNGMLRQAHIALSPYHLRGIHTLLTRWWYGFTAFDLTDCPTNSRTFSIDGEYLCLYTTRCSLLSR